jgi:hypothetical protein
MSDDNSLTVARIERQRISGQLSVVEGLTKAEAPTDAARYRALTHQGGDE